MTVKGHIKLYFMHNGEQKLLPLAILENSRVTAYISGLGLTVDFKNKLVNGRSSNVQQHSGTTGKGLHKMFWVPVTVYRFYAELVLKQNAEPVFCRHYPVPYDCK